MGLGFRRFLRKENEKKNCHKANAQMRTNEQKKKLKNILTIEHSKEV